MDLFIIIGLIVSIFSYFYSKNKKINFHEDEIIITEQFYYEILDADKRVCLTDYLIRQGHKIDFIKENLTFPSLNKTINNYIIRCVDLLDQKLFDKPPLEIYILHLFYNYQNETKYNTLSFRNIGRFNYYKKLYSVDSKHKYEYPISKRF